MTPSIVACSPDSCSASHNARPEHDVQRRVPDADAARDDNRNHQQRRDAERIEVDAVRVEDRDHEDRADVVDDREREQEELE